MSGLPNLRRLFYMIVHNSYTSRLICPISTFVSNLSVSQMQLLVNKLVCQKRNALALETLEQTLLKIQSKRIKYTTVHKMDCK